MWRAVVALIEHRHLGQLEIENVNLAVAVKNISFYNCSKSLSSINSRENQLNQMFVDRETCSSLLNLQLKVWAILPRVYDPEWGIESCHGWTTSIESIQINFLSFCFCRDTTAYVAEIINTIGQASAAAQGLNQPVTTSDRLRNSDDQVIYLLTEDNEKKWVIRWNYLIKVKIEN